MAGTNTFGIWWEAEGNYGSRLGAKGSVQLTSSTACGWTRRHPQMDCSALQNGVEEQGEKGLRRRLLGRRPWRDGQKKVMAAVSRWRPTELVLCVIRFRLSISLFGCVGSSSMGRRRWRIINHAKSCLRNGKDKICALQLSLTMKVYHSVSVSKVNAHKKWRNTSFTSELRGFIYSERLRVSLQCRLETLAILILF
jgi:hypothetical protein